MLDLLEGAVKQCDQSHVPVICQLLRFFRCASQTLGSVRVDQRLVGCLGDNLHEQGALFPQRAQHVRHLRVARPANTTALLSKPPRDACEADESNRFEKMLVPLIAGVSLGDFEHQVPHLVGPVLLVRPPRPVYDEVVVVDFVMVERSA